MPKIQYKKHHIIISAFAAVLTLVLVSGGFSYKGKLGGLKTQATGFNNANQIGIIESNRFPTPDSNTCGAPWGYPSCAQELPFHVYSQANSVQVTMTITGLEGGGRVKLVNASGTIVSGIFGGACMIPGTVEGPDHCAWYSGFSSGSYQKTVDLSPGDYKLVSEGPAQGSIVLDLPLSYRTPPPPSSLSITSFTATPSSIYSGSSSNLSWVGVAKYGAGADDSAYCNVKNPAGQVIASSSPNSVGDILGNISVSITKSSSATSFTYKLECQSDNAPAVSANTTITITYCGDYLVEPGFEQCDNGEDNGIDGICSDTCQLVSGPTPNSNPAGNFTVAVAGQDAQFTSNVTDSDGDPLTYFWDFGDPSTGLQNESTLQNPIHTYSVPGTYNVNLTVDDGKGGVINISQIVTISSVPTPIPLPKLSYLKALPLTTAETLLFTPSAKRTKSNWQLLKGVAEISTNGTIWYRSAAEVLTIGQAAEPHVLKSDGKEYVAPGTETTYTVEYWVNNTSSFYSADIFDQIKYSVGGVNASGAENLANLKITKVQYCDNDPNSCIDATAGNGLSVLTTNYFRFKTPASNYYGTHYFLKVTVQYLDGLPDGATVTNQVDVSLDGNIASAYDDNVIVRPFAQENIGGTIYAEGDINLRKADPNNSIPANLVYNARYIIAAGGAIVPDPETTSQENWKIDKYFVAPSSSGDLDAVNCVPGSACKIMKNNIDKLKKTTTPIIGSSVNAIDLSSDVPEGIVRWYSNGLTIEDSILKKVSVKGKGTIIVEGNLQINSDLIYENANSILGIIVIDGNVTIAPGVNIVNAIIYMDTKSTSSVGQFITVPNPAGDNAILQIKGAVIARGFTLKRNYIGTGKIGEAKQPAEQFQYDARLIFGPPPGFSAGMLGGS